MDDNPITDNCYRDEGKVVAYRDTFGATCWSLYKIVPWHPISGEYTLEPIGFGLFPDRAVAQRVADDLNRDWYPHDR